MGFLAPLAGAAGAGAAAGGFSTFLTIGKLIFSGVSAIVSARQAQQQADAQFAAQLQNFNNQQTELTRQQTEANRIAEEEKSDTVRRANQELGSIRVAAGEQGASESSALRIANELFFVEGLDLSRTEKNRLNRVTSLQSSKDSSRQGQQNIITQSFNEASRTLTSSVLGFFGSGLQILGDVDKRNREADRRRNRRT